ncbi:MAG: hypothetical protein ABEH43_07800, partial [Flavobacteriales bacterium]
MYFADKALEFPSLTSSNFTPNQADGKEVTNGYYGPNGDLLLYVADKQTSGAGDPAKVYNRYGNEIGDLFNQNQPPSPITWWEGIGPEVSIVPVPNSCKKYYLIYYLLGVDASSNCCLVEYTQAYYSVVDLSNNSIQGGEALTDPILQGEGGVAVGKLNGNNERNIYLAFGGGNQQPDNNKIKKLTMNSNGIIDNGSIYTTTNRQELDNMEMDLSFDGSKLAFGAISGGSSNDVNVIYLNSNGGFSSIWQPSVISSNREFTGVEFSPDGSKLYVGAKGEGIFQLNVNAQTVNSSPIPGTNSSHGTSQIELSHHPSGNYDILFAKSKKDISAITNPNSSYASLNFVNNYFSFNSDQIPSSNRMQQLLSSSGLYQLPDQIDGQDYTNTFSNSCQCCSFYKVFDAQSYTYDGGGFGIWSPSNNPWNQPVVNVRDELVIDENLVIRDMEFRFAPDAEVTVKKGAALFLQNTTFTADDCQCSMWEGVDIEGTYSAAYDDLNQQGRLNMSDNSMIEFARIGAETRLTEGNNQTGGSIVALNSDFKDNKIDVEVYPNQNNKTLSGFTNCEFYTTDDLTNLKGETPSVHMILVTVKDVGVVASTFENRSPSSYAYPDERGRGIFAYNADFNVIEDCQAPFTDRCPYLSDKDPSKFKNLNYGIAGFSSNSFRNAEIEGCDFVKNYRGVYLAGSNLNSLIANDFYVGSITNGTPPDNQSYGIYLKNCSQYAVEDNYFQQDNAFGYGIYVDNSNSGPNDGHRNMLYSNDFMTETNNTN